MKSFIAVVERDSETGLYVGFVPGFPGAHSQGATLDELRDNLQEVIEMLLEDGEPPFEGEFVGTQTIQVRLSGEAPRPQPTRSRPPARSARVREVRQRGSHKQFRHTDGRAMTVPFHRGRDTSPMLLRQILKDIGITVDEFLDA